MTFLELETQVLLVVGSVNDRFLGHGQCEILAEDGAPKIIRMSRPDFITNFLQVVKELGIDRLDNIVTHTTRAGRPVPIEFTGIEAADGKIGAIMMDRKTWDQLRNRSVSLSDIPLWATSRNGRKIEQVELADEAIAA